MKDLAAKKGLGADGTIDGTRQLSSQAGLVQDFPERALALLKDIASEGRSASEEELLAVRVLLDEYALATYPPGHRFWKGLFKTMSQRNLPTPTREYLSSLTNHREAARAVRSALVHRLIAESVNRDEYDVVRGWSSEHRLIYTTWRVVAEVDNGGLSQLFWNWNPALMEDAVSGFEILGARQYADLLRAALATFSNEGREYRTATSRGKTEGIPEAFCWFASRSRLDDLDDEFIEIRKEVDLEELQGCYILAHLERYVVDPHPQFPEPPEDSIAAN